MRWGTPIHPDEPMSQAIATLQNEITDLDLRLATIDDDDHPAARRIADWYETCRTEAWTLLTDYLDRDRTTEWSRARSPEELEHLLLPPITTTTPRIDYAAIKQRIDIVEYISRFGPIRKQGTTYLAHCPVHDDRHPSLTIYPATRSWYCFVCQKGGDVIDYERFRGGNVPAT